MTPQQREKWVKQMGARTDWWALRPEPVFAPEWEIIDAHCHLWEARTVPDPTAAGRSLHTSRYMPQEFLREAGGGHKLAAFVYVECGSGHYVEGPENLRPVGETEFAVAQSRILNGENGAPRLAAIAAYADVTATELDQVLDAHVTKGEGLVRAIRHSAARLDDPDARLLAGAAKPQLYYDPAFQRGVARLGERGFAFEAFQFHFQLEELASLIGKTPGTNFIVNHLGAPVGYGGGVDAEAELFDAWAKGMKALAQYPNVITKLGGMASPVTGYDASERDVPPSSEEFVSERGHYFHHAIGLFGAERCMFESNFPVDSVSLSYTTLWNAYKIIADTYSVNDRNALLIETARKTYGIGELRPAAIC